MSSYHGFPTQLVNSGEDVLVFYNDRASFQTLVQMMRSERDRMDENSPLMYHIHLVELLAVCTEGKNVYTEIKCNSLLPLDDIVRVVTHEDCIPEVWIMSFIYFFCSETHNVACASKAGLHEALQYDKSIRQIHLSNTDLQNPYD